MIAGARWKGRSAVAVLSSFAQPGMAHSPWLTKRTMERAGLIDERGPESGLLFTLLGTLMIRLSIQTIKLPLILYWLKQQMLWIEKSSMKPTFFSMPITQTISWIIFYIYLPTYHLIYTPRVLPFHHIYIKPVEKLYIRPVHIYRVN